MANFATIILFFLYLWGLGYTALAFVKKKPESAWENFFLCLGTGLGLFSILSIALNFLNLPLDWRIFLLLSVVFPGYVFFSKIRMVRLERGGKKEEGGKNNPISLLQLILPLASSFWSSLKPKKRDFYLLVAVLIAVLSFYMYTKGAFSYPYLEDEDPWGHAVGAKYVALEKNAYDPPLQNQQGIDTVLSYIDPYPPAYDILMGILHQTSPDLMWTLKFFNALLISLGLVFFFLLAKVVLEDETKAAFATFVLACIPAYLSHFIWAHSLAATLFFPTMYAFLQIKEDKRWMLPAIILVAGAWVSQNMEQPLKITSMILLFLLVGSLSHRRFFKYEALALVLGIAL